MARTLDLRLWRLVVAGLALLAATPHASAQQTPPPPAPAAPPGAPSAAAPSAAPSQPLTSPAMTAPLALNPTPYKFDAGPLGTIYGTGILSGVGFYQSNPFLGDHDGHFDITNGQAIVQKIDGPVQFYAQAGVYSLPALGSPYIRASDANHTFFGPLPVGWLKLAPTGSFNVQVGQLPTLIGAEYTFTFENLNIERGLLWNQEPAISRGVQVNYTAGPLALSASFNDGFYSDRFNWLVGSAAWTINNANTLTVVGGGNLGRSTTATLATPIAQNNGEILDVIYTYSAAPWTVTPYFQWTNVPSAPSLGWYQDAQTYGGALLVNYQFNDNWSLSGRVEAIGSTGSLAKGAPNLLYGPGSNAFSFTVTPTWQYKRFFVRAEGSIVDADSLTPGFGFGKAGNATTQVRAMLETGVIF